MKKRVLAQHENAYERRQARRRELALEYDANMTDPKPLRKAYSMYLQGIDHETISAAIGWQGDVDRVDAMIDFMNTINLV